jgi:hypothetical protein
MVIIEIPPIRVRSPPHLSTQYCVMNNSCTMPYCPFSRAKSFLRLMFAVAYAETHMPKSFLLQNIIEVGVISEPRSNSPSSLW